MRRCPQPNPPPATQEEGMYTHTPSCAGGRLGWGPTVPTRPDPHPLGDSTA